MAKLRAIDRLRAFGASAPQYAADLAVITELQRDGLISAERLQGLRSHALQIRRQLDELIALLPSTRPQA